MRLFSSLIRVPEGGRVQARSSRVTSLAGSMVGTAERSTGQPGKTRARAMTQVASSRYADLAAGVDQQGNGHDGQEPEPARLEQQQDQRQQQAAAQIAGVCLGSFRIVAPMSWAILRHQARYRAGDQHRPEESVEQEWRPGARR